MSSAFLTSACGRPVVQNHPPPRCSVLVSLYLVGHADSPERNRTCREAYISKQVKNNTPFPYPQKIIKSNLFVNTRTHIAHLNTYEYFKSHSF